MEATGAAVREALSRRHAQSGQHTPRRGQEEGGRRTKPERPLQGPGLRGAGRQRLGGRQPAFSAGGEGKERGPGRQRERMVLVALD